MAGWLSGTLRCAVSAAAAAGLVLQAVPPVFAAERVVPVIDGFGPYKLGMPVDEAKAADKGAKPGACGEIAADRQCLVLKAEVFQEPAVLFAVLDPAGARVERIVARLDPQLTRRRAYRCVRLSEKVFALLVVVYGSRYKQSYDQNRKPLPAVAWDGEESGRLVFEAKCRTYEEGNPTIRVVERYPGGKKPPQVAKKKSSPAPRSPAPVAAAPQAAGSVRPPSLDDRRSAAPVDDLPPPPPRVPVGVVEESALGPLKLGGDRPEADRLARLTRELEQAKGKGQPAPAKTTVPPLETRDAAKVTPAAPETSTAPATGNRNTVPLHIAPSPTGTAASAPSNVAVGAKAIPQGTPKPVADAAPATVPPPVPAPAPAATPAVAPVVDPGPVRIPKAPATPVADQPAPPAAGHSDAVQTARRTALEDVPGPATDAARPRSSQDGHAKNPAPVQPTDPKRTGPKTFAIAALTPQVRPPRYGDTYEMPEPTDLEAPEPFAMPEEEAMFRRQREDAGATAALARSETAIDAEVRRRIRTAASRRTPDPVAATGDAAGTVDTDARRAVRSGDGRAPAAGFVQPSSSEDRRAAPRAPAAQLSVAREKDPTPPAALQATPAPAPAALPSAPAPAPVPVAAPHSADSERVGEPAKVEPGSSADAGEETASAARTMVHDWANAKSSGFLPVMTGGWRHKAPVPPARPWRERAADSAGPGTDA